MNIETNIGDIMVERNGPRAGNLTSGCGSYSHAICVSVDPFVMVSQEGDMMWFCAKREHFLVLRAGKPKETQQALDRFHKRGRWDPDFGKPRPPKTHDLKCWPEFFLPIESNAKPFEIRYNDRDYQVGDVLQLREYIPGTDDHEGRYTGPVVERVITYKTDFKQKHGWVVLGLHFGSKRI